MGGIFILTLETEMNVDDSASMKDLNNCIDYETLYQLASQTMSETEGLVETVAAKLLKRIHESLPSLTRIKVMIEKPDPSGLFKSGKAVITLEEVYA